MPGGSAWPEAQLQEPSQAATRVLGSGEASLPGESSREQELPSLRCNIKGIS